MLIITPSKRCVFKSFRINFNPGVGIPAFFNSSLFCLRRNREKYRSSYSSLRGIVKGTEIPIFLFVK